MIKDLFSGFSRRAQERRRRETEREFDRLIKLDFEDSYLYVCVCGIRVRRFEISASEFISYIKEVKQQYIKQHDKGNNQ